MSPSARCETRGSTLYDSFDPFDPFDMRRSSTGRRA
jgi:hypothetical protein